MPDTSKASTTSFGTRYYDIRFYRKNEIGLPTTLDPSCAELPQIAPEPVGAVAIMIHIGLAKDKAEQAVQNKDLTKSLLDIVKKAGGPLSTTKQVGLLAYDLVLGASKHPWIKKNQEMLEGYILSGKIGNKVQLDAAYAFLKANGVDGPEFAKATGLGVVVTAEEVAAAVAAEISVKKDEILEKRYKFNAGFLMMALKKTLPWADGKLVKDTIDDQLSALLGPRTEADNAKPVKAKKEAKPKPAKVSAAGSGAATATGGMPVRQVITPVAQSGACQSFHKPGHNDETDGYIITPTTKSRLAAHVARTGGRVNTRFPPEPNGILHIGHAKAMNFNFAYAKAHNGTCLLRYDDTNPEKEEEEFFVGILENLTWLGHTPSRVTHSSDYFQELYDLAVKLIKSDDAYVCHMEASDLKGRDTEASPWRDRPITESLRLFEDMRKGKIDEGKATLRMKHTMKDGKLDPVAYRIKFCEHHRTKDKWCIYPTYDYTHCLVDSMEDISHSLCTKEFQNRRPSYYWLCNAVDVYCPVQWEYSRLNMGYAVVSKRKIAKLIDAKLVSGWDDPRLFTLSALRRRGFPPDAINDFCNLIGVTESTDTMIQPEVLEGCVRDSLNFTATRAMAVLEPLRVEIVDAPSDFPTTVPVDNIPFDKSKGSHSVPVRKVIFIERSDFEEIAPKGYKRLTPTQSVGLKYLSMAITVNEVLKKDGEVVGLKVSAAKLDAANKPKGYLHWVAEGGKVVEVRNYERLFHHSTPEDPKVVPGGFLNDVNTESLKTYQALIDSTVDGAEVGTTFQFERTGFYCVDPDSASDKQVFNLTVGLKGEAGAKK